MLDFEKAKIEKHVKAINTTYYRVLIMDCYEGYELKQLITALEALLDEVNKK